MILVILIIVAICALFYFNDEFNQIILENLLEIQYKFNSLISGKDNVEPKKKKAQTS